MPAAEVVEAAKKKGIKISTNLVYNIRSTSKSSGTPKGKGKPGPKPGSRRARGGRRTLGGGGAEVQLRNAIAALGLVKSREILAAVEAAFAGR